MMRQGFTGWASVVAGAVFAMAGVACSDDGDDGVSVPAEQSDEGSGAVPDLPFGATRALVEDLHYEWIAASVSVSGVGFDDVEVNLVDSRSEVDASVARLQVEVDGHEVATSIYNEVLESEGLNGLNQLRRDIDTEPAGATVAEPGAEARITAGYGELIDGLLDANTALVSSIEDPELRQQATLLDLALGQVDATARVQHRITTSLTGDEVALADLSELHKEISSRDRQVADQASTGDLAPATSRLQVALDRAGLEPALERILSDSDPELADTFEIIDKGFKVREAWSDYAHEVELILFGGRD